MFLPTQYPNVDNEVLVVCYSYSVSLILGKPNTRKRSHSHTPSPPGDQKLGKNVQADRLPVFYIIFLFSLWHSIFPGPLNSS